MARSTGLLAPHRGGYGGRSAQAWCPVPTPMSVSRIEAYPRGPQLYHRRYVDHIHEPESAPARLGRAFHTYAARSRTITGRLCAALEAQVWQASTIYSVEETVEYRWTDEAMTVAFEGIMDL